MDQAARTELMKEHTEATVAYLQTVRRKLYHSSALDDFHNLTIALEKVKENRHNRRLGYPTLLGTIRSLDESLEVLTR